ncbi:MAG: PEGA domain-containing protein [Candidatus Marinimicrobia bacterium]|nr:PEGA domain-containing protein [Candidatus Neomarinimicrobiota bacterium]
MEAASLTDRLRSELVRTGRVTVVERGQMEQVLAEQDFQLSGCTSNDCAVEVGQLLGVTIMLAGSIGKVGSTFSIDLRTIDVQTGRIVSSLIRNYRGEIDGLLDEMGFVAGELVELLAAESGEEPPAEPSPARATIRSEPAGAQVTLNGVAVGNTPLDSLVLAPEKPNRLTINLAGYAPIDTGLVPTAGEQYDLSWNLVALKSWLSVTSTPYGAVAILGGRRIGNTPIGRYEVTPGVPYKLSLRLRNHVRVDTSFTAIAGEHTRLNFPLQRISVVQTTPVAPKTQPAVKPKGGGRWIVMVAIMAAGGYYGYTEGWFGGDDSGERPTVGQPPGVPGP